MEHVETSPPIVWSQCKRRLLYAYTGGYFKNILIAGPCPMAEVWVIPANLPQCYLCYCTKYSGFTRHDTRIYRGSNKIGTSGDPAHVTGGMVNYPKPLPPLDVLLHQIWSPCRMVNVTLSGLLPCAVHGCPKSNHFLSCW